VYYIEEVLQLITFSLYCDTCLIYDTTPYFINIKSIKIICQFSCRGLKWFNFLIAEISLKIFMIQIFNLLNLLN